MEKTRKISLNLNIENEKDIKEIKDYLKKQQGVEYNTTQIIGISLRDFNNRTKISTHIL